MKYKETFEEIADNIFQYDKAFICFENEDGDSKIVMQGISIEEADDMFSDAYYNETHV